MTHPTFTPGQAVVETFKIDRETIRRFAEFSGDANPLHVDAEAARKHGYPRPVSHGAILIAYVSKMIGMKLPGPGALWMNQTVRWLLPVFEGDEIELTLTVIDYSSGARMLRLQAEAKNQKGKPVMIGEAQVKVAESLAGLPETVSSSTSVQASPATVQRPETPERKPGAAIKAPGRVALVTGGSRGIGAEIARALAAKGMAVAINYRADRTSAEALVRDIEKNGGIARAFPADLGVSESTERMIDSILETFGRCDAIIHGATPFIQSEKITDLKYDRLQEFLKVYLDGALSLVRKASPGMIRNKSGRFVFLGTSFLFGIPPAGLASYVIAKEALWGLVKSLATELGPLGVTTNMVSPSMTITDLTAEIPARMKELEARKSPLRRLAATQDTANLVAFLVGDEAAYINGANLPLTGGPV